MKPLLYIAALALTATACSTNRNFSSTIEDDIYYVPGKKALVVKEVENLTGEDISAIQSNRNYDSSESTSRSAGSTTPPASFSRSQSPVINSRTGQLNNINMSDMAAQAQEMLANNDAIDATLYENSGYWIGGYRGNEGDLPEIQRIINMYPEGFGYFSNGQDIALNLSFDSDWNVFTDNGRYWWFPSSSNINLYSSLLFGTYPKYIWTMAWDNPRFDSWTFNSSFNAGFNTGFNTGWYGSGWNFNFGWGSGWNRPYYNNWYGWNDPWYGGGYYPGWGYPHWHNPHWGHGHWGDGHYPNWGPPSYNRPPLAGHRPGNGGGVSGIRPGNTSRPSGAFRPGSTARPNTTSRPSGITRPSGTTRPNNGSMVRPGSSTTTRPGMTRPGNNNTVRPGNSVTRPDNSNQQQMTRPGTTRPNSNVTRPATRPASGNSQYTRPSNNNNSNVKNYTRPQNNSRPTYNNNSTTRYNSGSSSTPSRSNSGSSYTPSRSSDTPSRSGGESGGGSARPSSPSRPTRR